MNQQSQILAALIAATLIAGPAAAQTHPDIQGMWEPRGHGESHKEPLVATPEGEARFKTMQGLVKNGVSLGSRNCLPAGQPWNLQQSAPIDVVQDDREVSFMNESHSLPWHIFTDGRGHPDAAHLKPTLNGHSIGHWEGDALVVDTVGFAGRTPPAISRMTPSPTTHLVARFTLDPDGERLHAHFVQDDPVMLAKPYEWDFVWYRSAPGAYVQNEVCDASDPAFATY